MIAAACAPSPPSGGVIYTGQGFDTCAAPSVSTMQAWTSSPYHSLGIYIGGLNRGCAQPNLSPSWTQAVENQGWRLAPLYVGVQAPCVFQGGLGTMSSDPGTARGQGQLSAIDAINHAGSVGLGPGTPIYFDMEAYNNSDASCTNAVLSFMSGWSSELRGRSYLDGEYSSAASGIVDQLKTINNPAYTTVYEVWIAEWNNDCLSTQSKYIPGVFWSQHQRLHQCIGGHDENWGGVTINIDTDFDDGAVAGR